jgi:MFS transporter, FHS family, L-fucose permease
MNKQATGINAPGKINPIIIIGILYFIFGFVTWLNGTLIPFLKISCELTNFQAYLVTSAFYISYLVMALPSSFLLQKTGFKNGIAYGLIIMGLGSILFIPAALNRSFPIFLTGLFIQGSGLALLQTAANPYVAFLGDPESAAKRISIMGICNKVAGVLSPLILGSIILSNPDALTAQIKSLSGAARGVFLDTLAQRVILPYIVMALILAGLAYLIKFAHLPEIDAEEDKDSALSNGKSKTSIFQYPHLILGFITLFLYVGVEVIAGDTIILYGQSQGIALGLARRFTSMTLTAMVIGYILGIITIPKYIKQDKALGLSAILGIIFSLGVVFTSGFTSVMFLALLGLANALMWPAIWPLSIADLGKMTKAGSALLVMGIAGGATIPLLYGRLADIMNPQQAYWLLFPIYAFILFFAVKGHKIRK